MNNTKPIKFIFTDGTELEILTVNNILDHYDIDQVKTLRPYKSIKSIIIPDGIEIIDRWTFKSMYTLQSVHLPSTIKEIRLEAFADCRSLTSINFPESLQVIGHMAFARTSIEHIVLSEKYKLEGNPFKYCKANVISIGDKSFKKIPAGNPDYMGPYPTKQDILNHSNARDYKAGN